jgi:Tfp pilus assembly ATPase PilU
MSELTLEEERRAALLTQKEERRVALAVIRGQIIRGQIDDAPDVITLLFARAIEQIEPEALESVAFLASNDHGPMLRVIDWLVERQMAGLQTDIQAIEEAITVVRKVRDPDGRLRGNVMRPHVFVEHIADELLNAVSIKIGEIRDSETAKKSVEAALTGHLVLVGGHDDE